MCLIANCGKCWVYALNNPDYALYESNLNISRNVRASVVMR